MKRAAFRVFASLGANDEDIRKRIIETEHLMDSLVTALEDASNSKLQMAAIGCLHSLTRSVQLLRTTFQVKQRFLSRYNSFKCHILFLCIRLLHIVVCNNIRINAIAL